DPRLGGGMGVTFLLGGKLARPNLLHLNLSGERPIGDRSNSALSLFRAALAAELPVTRTLSLQGEFLREVLMANSLDLSGAQGQGGSLTLGLTWQVLPW